MFIRSCTYLSHSFLFALLLYSARSLSFFDISSHIYFIFPLSNSFLFTSQLHHVRISAKDYCSGFISLGTHLFGCSFLRSFVLPIVHSRSFSFASVVRSYIMFSYCPFYISLWIKYHAHILLSNSRSYLQCV